MTGERTDVSNFSPDTLDFFHRCNLDPQGVWRTDTAYRVPDLSEREKNMSVQVVDLVEQIDQFPKKTAGVLLKYCKAIQLNTGCLGNCPFCLFDPVREVTAKYSFSSIQKVLQNKRDNIYPYNELPDDFLWYFAGDIGDYDAGIANIFQETRDSGNKKFQFFSTSVPRGSGERLSDLWSFLAKEYFLNKTSSLSGLRISYGRHNGERVYAFLQQGIQKLKQEGFDDDQITEVINAIDFSSRFPGEVAPLGRQITKFDPFAQPSLQLLPVCGDGVVFTPDGVVGTMMVMPTTFTPSGQVTWSISPKETNKVIPDIYSFSTMWSLVEDLSNKNNDIMLPIPTETAALHLERYALCLAGILTFWRWMYTVDYFPHARNMFEQKKKDMEKYFDSSLAQTDRVIYAQKLAASWQERMKAFYSSDYAHMSELEILTLVKNLLNNKSN